MENFPFFLGGGRGGGGNELYSETGKWEQLISAFVCRQEGTICCLTGCSQDWKQSRLFVSFYVLVLVCFRTRAFTSWCLFLNFILEAVFTFLSVFYRTKNGELVSCSLFLFPWLLNRIQACSWDFSSGLVWIKQIFLATETPLFAKGYDNQKKPSSPTFCLGWAVEPASCGHVHIKGGS